MWYEKFLEKNLIPDFLIRAGIRSQLARKIGIEERQKRKASFINELKQSPIAICTDDANQQHYEVPPEFFHSVLGKYLKYSSGYWPESVSDLDASEEAMLELYCERAQLQEGQRILDLGCGWGSLSLFLAKKYPGSQVTALSNSKPQKLDIEKRAHEEGITNLEVLTDDIRHFQTDKKFDRVLSIEMFEHMRNYELLFQKVTSWMNPGGKLFVHVFCHKEFAYPYETENKSNWMAQYFFSGGIMPSEDLFRAFPEHVATRKQWRVDGKHYQKTCEAWLKKMDSHKDEIMQIFRKTYGENQALKWWVRWRVFFMACAELFGYKDGQEWFVSHSLFEVKTSPSLAAT